MMRRPRTLIPDSTLRVLRLDQARRCVAQIVERYRLSDAELAEIRRAALSGLARGARP